MAASMRSLNPQDLIGMLEKYADQDEEERELKMKLIGAKNVQVKKQREEEQPKKKEAKAAKKGKKERFGPAMEVDLHAEKLLPDSRKIPAHELLDLQVETARRQLEFALRKRIQRLVFIHGVGEGVLREELHTLLRRYEGLRYHDADYAAYGLGATEVYIPQESF